MSGTERERVPTGDEAPPGAPARPPEDVDTSAPVSTNERGEKEDLPDLHGDID